MADKDKNYNPISHKLAFLNIAIIISVIIGLYLSYLITKGAKLQELNYLHTKYNFEFLMKWLIFKIMIKMINMMLLK